MNIHKEKYLDQKIPFHLKSLQDDSHVIRKVGARQLVGKLSRKDTNAVISILDKETHPPVLKWLGMEIARAGIYQACSLINDKKESCTDLNTRDWLEVFTLVLQPRDNNNGVIRLLNNQEKSVHQIAAIEPIWDLFQTAITKWQALPDRLKGLRGCLIIHT
jgi:hypothetical protein